MKRVVFAAIVAYTDRPTADDRQLATPEGPVLHRPYPLSVFGWTDEHPVTKERQAVRIGSIELAFVCDRRLIVFGRMFSDEATRPYVEALAAGTSWLEIDVDHLTEEFPPPTNAEPGPAVTFTTWRLTSAYIGEAPCWDLPPVQIEEMTA